MAPASRVNDRLKRILGGSGPRTDAVSASNRVASGYAGFCVGGYSWSTPALTAALSPAEAQALRRRNAHIDAVLTRSLGGNLLRSFWLVERVLEGDPEDLALALNAVSKPDLQNRSVFMHDLETRVARLDRCHVILDQLLAALEGVPGNPIRLDFSELDAALTGLEDANREATEPVRLLLTMVISPPRWIIEAPSDATFWHLERPYNFGSLWHRYVRFHAELHRRLVVRYAVERPLTGLCALEIGNEPDYQWTPEEVKIEGGGDPVINPFGKYVTELHLGQVPVGASSARPFELTESGVREQDAAWASPSAVPVPVLDFDWGPKFDWYVMCFAQLQTHVAAAIKSEAAVHGVDVSTVSGSVTHNNIDYLLRMHRADENAFANIDKIGVHPYHWADNDVWDSRFVSGDHVAGWAAADPRRFAQSFFKRFDFLSAFRASSGDPRVDQEIRTVFGERKLWITEFGIGSKVLGAFNAAIERHTHFIRPRGLVGSTAGNVDVIWEDLWNAFLDQVDAGWLRDRNVECLLIYSLREMGISGTDLDDEDRSNLAISFRDGTPRLDPPVMDRVSDLLHEVAGRRRPARTRTVAEVPPELYRRPWRAVELSENAKAVMTMLSIEERQLLYWATSEYRTGAGAIVDGGSFVGGSTVPLAEGLRAAGSGGVVDVYDRFEVEPYMTDFYFKDEDLRAGESFRPVFDRNTAEVTDLLRVNEGDLLEERWRGEPIEILFIDCAKSWLLNDFIVAEFFPSLIPGRSIVVQQDFVYALCPWVALTMEHLSEYFVPVGFAEYCSVVYLCRREIPRDLAPVSELGLERRLELMECAIARFRGYPRTVLECARATLFVEQGDLRSAADSLERIAVAGTPHHVAQAALEQARSLV